ncbi:MAG: PCRF domain-containing protein, partial [Spirochaetales bacterium]|nr:PCRF domain-containing protein [Spirochaetales bacterium]
MPGGVFDPDILENKISELEQKTLSSNFWDNRENAEKTYSEISALKEKINPWKKLLTETQEIFDFYELYKEEPDLSELENDIITQITNAKKEFDDLYTKSLLSDIYDSNDAFITIHSGAGGTEACDWVNMLLRMYMRWIEGKGYKTQILDLLEAEGGVKSVTLEVSGKNAYGYLKSESGVHRLVRISPFDSNKRRHTTFASVYVSPVIEEVIDIDIRPEDIRVDTYRA